MKKYIELFKTKLDFKDPMTCILSALLVFLTCGTAFAGCAGNKPVIELDAAFGGDNKGYEGIINEADFTREVTDRLQKLLEEDGHFQVIATHDSGTSSSVASRAEKIAADQPDLVLSIHASGSPDPAKSGTVIYADIPSEETHDASLKAAQAVADAFKEDTEVPVRYLYYKPMSDNSFQIQYAEADDTTDYQMDTWELMKQADAPVVIADQISVTNQADVDKWANEEGYQKAAETYYQALKNCFGVK